MQLATRHGSAWLHGLYSDVLTALDLRARLTDRDRALAFLESHLDVEPRENTGVIVLRLRMPDAALAVKVQQTLLERYQTRRVQVHQTSRPTAPTAHETERLRESLARAEEDLTRAQQAAALAGRVTSGADASTSLLAELEERHRRVEQNYLASLKRYNAASDRACCGCSPNHSPQRAGRFAGTGLSLETSVDGSGRRGRSFVCVHSGSAARMDERRGG